MPHDEKKVQIPPKQHHTVARNKVVSTELSARELVDRGDKELTKKGKQRRAILRYTGPALLGLAWVWDALAKWSSVEGVLQNLERTHIHDPNADQKLLEKLLGIESVGSAALLPATDHPFKKPPEGGYYPIELDNCAAYKQRFFDHARFRTVSEFPKVQPDDSVVLFGSQVSNLATRLLLGNPFGQERPQLDLVREDLGWKARLHWNLYTPTESEVIERQQFGGPWITHNHVIGDERGDQYRSRVRGKGLDDDYLLITALPRLATGKQKFIVFSGCHGPGQKAATSLLSGSFREELLATAKGVDGEPYYQALFNVYLTKDSEGEFVPRGVHLVAARPLDLQFEHF
jgi:hypothetical protein